MYGGLRAFMKVNGYIGNVSGKCRACGTEGEHSGYAVKEMFFGTREEFMYFECSHCHCMQIKDVPNDMGKYYDSDYYSMKTVRDKNLEFPKVTKTSGKVLDVGCGTGSFLIERAKQGFGELYGCDPFIKEDLQYADRITIKKCTIHEMTGKFDVIVFNDSFEHMSDPLETLQSVKRLMNEDGICKITMPIYPNAAWETFGINWYQWDAPRHLMLHSRQSMQYLCERAGLRIEKVEYDSNVLQFALSYLYEQGIPLQSLKSTDELKSHFDKATWDMFVGYSMKVNEKEYGDHAVFFLKHLGNEKPGEVNGRNEENGGC